MHPAQPPHAPVQHVLQPRHVGVLRHGVPQHRRRQICEHNEVIDVSVMTARTPPCSRASNEVARTVVSAALVQVLWVVLVAHENGVERRARKVAVRVLARPALRRAAAVAVARVGGERVLQILWNDEPPIRLCDTSVHRSPLWVRKEQIRRVAWHTHHLRARTPARDEDVRVVRKRKSKEHDACARGFWCSGRCCG